MHSIIRTYPGKRSHSVDQLHPITVRVVDESKISHVSIRRSLFHGYTFGFHLCAGAIEVVHDEADVPEALRLSIAVMRLEVRVLLSAMVPTQCENVVPPC